MAVKAASASFCRWSSVVFAGSAVGFGFGFDCGVGLSMVLGCLFGSDFGGVVCDDIWRDDPEITCLGSIGLLLVSSYSLDLSL